MSIKAKPWEGGGAASVPDASETVKGIIRIATSAEATTGTDDTIAMTPLTVKERIDASLVGGVEYKGTFNATAGTPSLANAEKGDLYIIDTAGTIYGQTWAVGDHLLINENMGGSVTNSKIDKVDNTDAVTSVNTLTGAVVLSGDDLAADHVAVNYTAANANIDGHLSGIDAALASVGDNQIVDVEIKAASSFTASSNYIYLCGYTSGTQTITFPAASSSNDGDLIALSSNNGSRSVSIVSSDGTTNDIIDVNNTAKGGTNGGLSLDIDRQLVWFSPSGTSWRQLNGALATVATTGAYSDLSGTPTLATVATTGAYSDLSGTPTLATVATTGAYSDLSGTPTLATVATTGAYSDLSGLPTLGTAAAADTGDFLASTAGLNDLSDVTISSVSNGQVISYNSTSGEWENSTPASGGATDLDGLSDVTITSAASGNLLENNGSGQFVNVAKSTIDVGSFNDDGTYLKDVIDDTTPQLGGDLDVNGQSITSAANGDVTIDPNGTGDIVVGADVLPAADSTHTLGAEDNRFITLHSELNGAVQFKARNESGGALTKGQAVYISGVSGTVPLISLARANSASTMPAFGLLAADVNNNADVQVITFGNLTDYNTTTYSLSANDTVYVSAATAGALTSTAPTGESSLIQNIGRVVRADASAGIIKVGGAGRSNATPNLDDGKIFLGNASNQAVSTALSAIDVGSFNDDGTYQPLDAGLTSISGLTTSANKMVYTTASDTYAVADLTAAGRALLDDADATAQRTTLELGSAATSESTDFLASTAGLNDLSDVTISSVSNGQVISYNSTSGEWENSTPASGGGQPNLTVVSNTSYTLSAANAPNIYIWYGASNSSTFTVTMPAIADVISDIAGVNGSPAETFEVHIGRGQGGDITVSASNGIDLLGDGSVTYSTTQTINAGEWIKLIGWKTSSSNARYLMNSPISQLTNLSDVTITSATSGNLLQHNGTAFVNVAKSTIDVGTFNDDGTYQPLDAGLTSISGLTTAADKMIYTTASDTYAVADLTSAGRALLDDADASAQRTTLGLGTAATSASTDFLASTAGLNDLSDVSFTAGAGIDNYVLTYDHSTTSWGAEAAAGGGSSWTYSAITADPANAQAGYHYSCTGTFTITLPTSGVSSGEEIRVKNMGTGTITIDPQTQNIDDSNTDYVMDVRYSAITLVSTGTHWEVI